MMAMAWSTRTHGETLTTTVFLTTMEIVSHSHPNTKTQTETGLLAAQEIMVSMKIASNIELFVNWGAASALGVVLLVLSFLILWVASRFLKLDQITGGGH